LRVLLVEDDRLLGEGLQLALRRAGYTVDWLVDGVAAVAALRSDDFDLMVLDLGLPRMDGQAVIKAVREAGASLPILVLTARDQVQHRVDALDAGADDFLGKPFDSAELLARLRALLRRREGGARQGLAYAGVELDTKHLEVQVDGSRIDLPRREFALLRALVEHAGRIVSREHLQQALYGWDDDVASNTLDVHIHHLRRKLGPERIRTVRGVGYALVAPGR
jgi:DNA-binding response OmpR family regulator